jgi:hypothetical protein
MAHRAQACGRARALRDDRFRSTPLGSAPPLPGGPRVPLPGHSKRPADHSTAATNGVDEVRRWMRAARRALETGVGSASRELGVPRRSLHRWLARYQENGIDGLVERSRRPLELRPTIPTSTGSSSLFACSPTGIRSGSRLSWPAAASMRSATPTSMACSRPTAALGAVCRRGLGLATSGLDPMSSGTLTSKVRSSSTSAARTTSRPGSWAWSTTIPAS